MKFVRALSLGGLAAVAMSAMVGCGVASARSDVGTYIFAFDTSASAKDGHEKFFNRGIQELMGVDSQARLVVYRFDVNPQEAFQGSSLGNDEEAAMLLKQTLDRNTGKKGTNLLRLFQEFDRRFADWSKPIHIKIYTDCGTERMSESEFRQLLDLTRTWRVNGMLPDLSFIGVDTGYRERLRDNIAFPVAIE
jgi:hypothetical protein